MNVKSVLIDFGGAIHGTCNEFISYLIEVSRFLKETYWIWKGNPYYLVAIPLKPNGNTLVLKGNPLNLARKSIEFEKAIHRICNDVFWNSTTNHLVLKGNPLNLVRNFIEFGEGMYKVLNEFIPHLTEVNGF